MVKINSCNKSRHWRSRSTFRVGVGCKRRKWLGLERVKRWLLGLLTILKVLGMLLMFKEKVKEVNLHFRSSNSRSLRCVLRVKEIMLVLACCSHSKSNRSCRLCCSLIKLKENQKIKKTELRVLALKGRRSRWVKGV